MSLCSGALQYARLHCNGLQELAVLHRSPRYPLRLIECFAGLHHMEQHGDQLPSDRTSCSERLERGEADRIAAEGAPLPSGNDAGPFSTKDSECGTPHTGGCTELETVDAGR